MKIDNDELRAVSAAAAKMPPDDPPRYAAIGGQYEAVPKERLRAAGWNVTKSMPPVTRAVPDTWVDLETGEVLSKAEARKRGIKLPGGRSASDKALDLCLRLAGCTASERPFVRYLLQMRNHRGGLVAPVDSVLDIWISRECPGIRSTDKARKRKQLRSIIERRKLMVNDLTMARDIQILNPRIAKQDILEEGARWHAKWAVIPRMSIPSHTWG